MIQYQNYGVLRKGFEMTQNEGTADRIIRVVLGIAAVLVAAFLTTGVADIILYIIGAILIITGLTGVCLIYKLFNYSTKK